MGADTEVTQPQAKDGLELYQRLEKARKDCPLQTSKGYYFVNTLILDCWPLKFQENKFL